MQTTVVEAAPLPLLLSVKEAAHSLRLSRTSIWRLSRQGDLEARRIGGRTLITMESVRRLAEQGTTDRTAA